MNWLCSCLGVVIPVAVVHRTMQLLRVIKFTNDPTLARVALSANGGKPWALAAVQAQVPDGCVTSKLVIGYRKPTGQATLPIQMGDFDGGVGEVSQPWARRRGRERSKMVMCAITLVKRKGDGREVRKGCLRRSRGARKRRG